MGGGLCPTGLNQAIVREQGLGQLSAALWAKGLCGLAERSAHECLPQAPWAAGQPPPAAPLLDTGPE